MRSSGLTLAVLFATLAPANADTVSEPRGRAGFSLFMDSQSTTVWTPYGEVNAMLPGRVDLEARWSADIITSASVDVVTAATSRMSELRQEVGVSARHGGEGGALGVDAGYSYSFERDAASHIMQAGVHRGFFDDNLEAQLRFGLSLNRTGLVGEPADQWRTFDVYSGELALSRVLGSRTIAELVYSVFVVDGYQASPYRRVPILIGPDLRGAMWLPEQVPDSRLRQALTLRLRHAFEHWIGSVAYRFYVDDWGIISHTESIEGARDLRRGFSLRLRERASMQGGANFYRQEYDSAAGYRTRDRRLSRNDSLMAGAALRWERGAVGRLAAVRLDLGADALAWRFDDFLAPALSLFGQTGLAPLGWVGGALAQASLEVDF